MILIQHCKLDICANFATCAISSFFATSSKTIIATNINSIFALFQQLQHPLKLSMRQILRNTPAICRNICQYHPISTESCNIDNVPNITIHFIYWRFDPCLQAHGRRHTGGFPIDLGGIAGETALVRGKMIPRVWAGGAAGAPPASALEIFSPNWVKFPQQNTPGTYALFNAQQAFATRRHCENCTIYFKHSIRLLVIVSLF